VTVGVLALQGDVREHAAAFGDLGEDVRAVRRPVDLDGLSGMVLPGGESTTLSLLLGSAGLDRALDDAFRAGLPVFGTCAGLILLAERVLDGRPDQHQFGAIDLTVRRNAYGHQAASFEADLEVPTIGPAPLPAVFIRAPLVVAVGAEVEVLALLPPPQKRVGGPGADVGAGLDGDPGASQPVVCRQGSVLVSAFHPELTPDRRLHRLFLDMIKDVTRAAGHQRPGRSEPG
jgi:pyridoxal 5'-phosphate synthase pdxT subunit